MLPGCARAVRTCRALLAVRSAPHPATERRQRAAAQGRRGGCDDGLHHARPDPRDQARCPADVTRRPVVAPLPALSLRGGARCLRRRRTFRRLWSRPRCLTRRSSTHSWINQGGPKDQRPGPLVRAEVKSAVAARASLGRGGVVGLYTPSRGFVTSRRCSDSQTCAFWALLVLWNLPFFLFF